MYPCHVVCPADFPSTLTSTSRIGKRVAPSHTSTCCACSAAGSSHHRERRRVRIGIAVCSLLQRNTKVLTYTFSLNFFIGSRQNINNVWHIRAGRMGLPLPSSAVFRLPVQQSLFLFPLRRTPHLFGNRTASSCRKAGVRKRSSSASAVRREVPVSGNGIPGCREQDSQPLGTGFPTGWEHLSQECGHRDRCVFNVFA